MSDYEWSDMPQDLALKLKVIAESPEEFLPMLGADLQEWLLNEMKGCAASPREWPRLTASCPDLPEVGSEFCKAHDPEDDDG